MENKDQITKVGVGVLLFKDGKVLFGKRKGAHGAGDYAGPGGHLDYMESFEDCAKRETLEECGVNIKNVRFLNLANINQFYPKHYVHISVAAEWESGELKNMEPDKCESWDWYDLENLPENLFLQARLGVESYKTGKNYFDIEK